MSWYQWRFSLQHGDLRKCRRRQAVRRSDGWFWDSVQRGRRKTSTFLSWCARTSWKASAYEMTTVVQCPSSSSSFYFSSDPSWEPKSHCHIHNEDGGSVSRNFLEISTSCLFLFSTGHPFSESTLLCGCHIIGRFLGTFSPDVWHLTLKFSPYVWHLTLKIFSSTGPSGSPLEKSYIRCCISAQTPSQPLTKFFHWVLILRRCSP